jgi:hypothetical protein
VTNEIIILWNDNTVIANLTDARGLKENYLQKLYQMSWGGVEIDSKIEKCALKYIKILEYIIIEEWEKIYRNKGGSFEIIDFISPEMKNIPLISELLN